MRKQRPLPVDLKADEMWCFGCSKALPATDFNPSQRAHGRVGQCRQCKNAYYRSRKGPDGKSYFNQYRRKYWSERIALSTKMKAVGCADCGNQHPAVLTFHHVDPSTKVDSVSRMVATMNNKSALIAEIQKCIVLCENCHRIRHYNERMAKKAAARQG